jgi:esterase/lipase superfamily enzyme
LNASSVAELADQDTQLYLLSWPAGSYLNGNTTYQWSTWSAGLGAGDLNKVINWVARCHLPSNISIMAHSKGAHVALSLLLSSDINLRLAPMDNLILAAPDHSLSDFRNHAAILSTRFQHIYVLQSYGDEIVKIGSLLDVLPRDSLGYYSGSSPSGLPSKVIFMVALPDAKVEEPGGLETLQRIHSSYIWNQGERAEISRILSGRPSLACPAKVSGYLLIDPTSCGRLADR